jgi:hypothetical protein
MKKFFPVSSFLFFSCFLVFGFLKVSAQANDSTLRVEYLSLVAHSGSQPFWCRRFVGNQTSQIGCSAFYWVESPGVNTFMWADFQGNADTEFVLFNSIPGSPQQSRFTAYGGFPGFTFNFGLIGDDPTVLGDYTGDRIADLAVFRCNPNAPVGTQCYWIYRQSEIGFVTWIPWGTVYAPGKADIAAPGDYDGDGKHDFAVRRPSNPSDPNSQQIFYILRSSDGAAEYHAFGLGSDKFVKGDYDGDGKIDLCAVRNTQIAGAQMQWFIRYSSTGGFVSIPFGLGKSGAVGDYLAPGDYTVDGRSDIGVWRRTAANELTYFYVLPSTANPGVFAPIRYMPVDACPVGQCEYPVSRFLVH